MKKQLSLLATIIFIVFFMIGCGQKFGSDGDFQSIDGENTNNIDEGGANRSPMVMVNGLLYIDTGKDSDLGARCGVMDGEITSTVEVSEIPQKDNQSNFGTGYGYQFVDKNSLDIYMNERWIRFERNTKNTQIGEDDWGMQLTATNVTSTGMTLVCNQLGRQPTGDLQTGSLFLLEIQRDNEWISVERLPAKFELAWTEEAWPISLNDCTEWEVNWSGLYGVLPVGNYRIGKEIMNFRDSDDYDTKTYYANFEVMN